MWHKFADAREQKWQFNGEKTDNPSNIARNIFMCA
jgi:hypothetical protein